MLLEDNAASVAAGSYAVVTRSGMLGPMRGNSGPDATDIKRLITGESIALRYPGFSTPEACTLIADRLEHHPLGGFYSNAPAIGRIGTAYFEAEDAPSKIRYYNQAAPAIRELRTTCLPYINPMDQLRLVLSEEWPAGATLENIEGKPMFVGLTRIFTRAAEALPHQDVLAWDAPPECMRASELIVQLAANVYLRPAKCGGELELWETSLTRDQYESSKLPGSYGLDRSKLPASSLTITPQVGELIIFNANKTHAVRPVIDGPRITVSCFIGVRGLQHALTVWS